MLFSLLSTQDLQVVRYLSVENDKENDEFRERIYSVNYKSRFKTFSI